MELRKAFLLVVFCLSFLVGLGYAEAGEFLFHLTSMLKVC
jgi:hypothetical protein